MRPKLEMKDVCEVLFESANEGLLVVDRKGIIYLANPRLWEMFGYNKNELLGKPVECLVPENKRKEHPEYRRQYYEHPVRRQMDGNENLTGQRKDGSIFPVEVSLNYVNIQGHEYVMALVSDISERRKSEERTRLYADIVESIQMGICVFHLEKREDDRSLKVVSFNPAAEQQTGLMESKVLHCYIDNVFPFARKQGIVRRLAASARSGSKTLQEELIYNEELPKGKSWALKIFGLPGQCAAASFEDITVRHKAWEHLKDWNKTLEQRVAERTRDLNESQQLYRMIAQNFPNGEISVLDRKLNYVFVDGIELHKRKFRVELLEGKSFIQRIDPQMREDVKEKLRSVFNGQNSSFELQSANRIYQINAVGLRGVEENISQILVVSQNITNLKRAEEKMQQAWEKEKILNESKSRFVSMASHEFRTPLTSVMNSANLLSKYINEEKQQRYVSRIKVSVHHLTNILNDFLSLDKLDQGEVKISAGHFKLKDLVDEVIGEMEGLLKQSQTILYNHRGGSMIDADRQMLKSIFINLLSNAIKYSPEGKKILVNTRVDEPYLFIEVVDSGIGISRQDQDHLFERFFRANNALHIQGTGLGLNIVKKYVDMVKGEIYVESDEHKGSCFKLKIPLGSATQTIIP